MRQMIIVPVLRAACVLLLIMLLPAFGKTPGTLGTFAGTVGLHDVEAFVAAVTALRQTARLPEPYLTKTEAERLGWRPGDDLCDVAPDRIIGGDRFMNRERLLPEARGRRWFEADLDFACGRRGAKRLLFSSDGLIFVTVDHYESFQEVPR